MPQSSRSGTLSLALQLCCCQFARSDLFVCAAAESVSVMLSYTMRMEGCCVRSMLLRHAYEAVVPNSVAVSFAKCVVSVL